MEPVAKFLFSMLSSIFMLLLISIIVYVQIYVHYKLPRTMAVIDHYTLSNFFSFLQKKNLQCIGVTNPYAEIYGENDNVGNLYNGRPSFRHPLIVNAVLMLLYFTYPFVVWV